MKTFITNLRTFKPYFFNLITIIITAVLAVIAFSLDAQTVTQHKTPVAGKHYDSTIHSKCANCTIYNAKHLADMSSSNYAVMYLDQGKSHEISLHALLDTTSSNGTAGFILQYSTGKSTKASILNYITINAYKSQKLISSSTGSTELTLTSNKNGLVNVESDVNSDFDALEIVFSGMPNMEWKAAIYQGYGSKKALPVSLIHFAGRSNDNIVKLHWATATELNNSHFEITKSIDGQTFNKIGVVDGFGNSNQIINYDFTDLSAEIINYYQLIQVDFDGTRTLSDMIIVKSTKQSSEELQVYPNPSARGFVNVTSPSMERSKLILANYRGQVLRTSEIEGYGTLQLTNLSSGIYFLSIESSTGVIGQKRIVIQ